MKNNLRQNKGITLIALVITIIVLLILAGVSIATLTGENGILTQAQSSKTANKKAEAEEIFKLIANEWQIEKRANKNADLGEFLEAKETEYGDKLEVTGNEAPYTLEYNGEKVTIDNNGTLTEVTNGGGNTVEKWTQPYEIAGFTHIAGTWDTGYVIQDNDTKSEFVWIPVGCTINGVTINLDRVFYDDNLMTNEWVEEINHGQVKKLESYLSSSYGVSTKAEYWNLFSEGADYIADFQASVAANGGFYIGRYEASYGDGGKVETVVSSGTPRSSSSTALTDGMLWNCISQTDAIEKCNEMYNGHESGIKSRLVNSYAWDTALKFINAVEGKNVDTDSSAWGNYIASLANTGATSKAVACNIYDMAGNLQELTTENITVKGTTNAVDRGGSYNLNGANYPAGFRSYNRSTFTQHLGFRPLLFK